MRYVYLLQNRVFEGQRYVGITSDLRRRLTPPLCPIRGNAGGLAARPSAAAGLAYLHILSRLRRPTASRAGGDAVHGRAPGGHPAKLRVAAAMSSFCRPATELQTDATRGGAHPTDAGCAGRTAAVVARRGRDRDREHLGDQPNGRAPPSVARPAGADGSRGNLGGVRRAYGVSLAGPSGARCA